MGDHFGSKERAIYLLACTCHRFLPHYALLIYYHPADVHPHFGSILFSVPDTPRPVRWQHRPRFDPFDPILTHFKPLRQIPQEKVDKHAAGTRRCAAVCAQSRSNTFHSDDRRGAYGDLLARTAWKFFVRVEGRDERGGVGEYSEVVEDLRDAVVREHGELADAVREERVWIGVGGRREGCPSLGYHDLSTFPEEDCSMGGRSAVCLYMRVIGDDTNAVY
jgi:hypothetical protein